MASPSPFFLQRYEMNRMPNVMRWSDINEANVVT